MTTTQLVADLPSGDFTAIRTLNLPAGSYTFVATVMLHNVSSPSQIPVLCDIDDPGNAPSAVQVQPNASDTLTVIAAHTYAEPTAVSLFCISNVLPDAPLALYESPTLIATLVGELESQ